MTELILFLLLIFPLTSLIVENRFRIFIISGISSFFLFILQPYILIIALISCILNFCFSHILFKRRNIFLLWIFVIIHILILIFFKVSSLQFFFRMGFEHSLFKNANVWISLGLSYYSMQGISYLVDIYLTKAIPEKNFFILYNYFTFFPKFIMGPIEKSGFFFKQILAPLPLKKYDYLYAIFLITTGLFKKEFLADTLEVFTVIPIINYQSYNGLILFITIFLKGIVLYYNFSGTIDMVRGGSLFFGINLSRNFYQPFFSESILEFWRRWHTTFFIWMRDYIFYPLAQFLRNFTSLKGSLALSLIVCFTISGLWHSFKMNFILFGFIHGVLCILQVGSQDMRSKFYKKFRINIESTRFKVFSILSVQFFWVISLFLTSFNGLKESYLFANHVFLSFFNLNSLYGFKKIFTEAFALGAFPLHFFISIFIVFIFLVIEYFEKFNPNRLDYMKSYIQRTPYVFIYLFIVIQFILFSPRATLGHFIYLKF